MVLRQPEKIYFNYSQMMIIMKQDTEAKLKQIVDTLFDKERAKIQAKLDNLEQSHNKQIKFFQIKLNNATTEKQKQCWQTKLAEIRDINIYRSYLLVQLESYN
jgi:O6-methylguanine-DNA--protein-cysteine methyltransferase